MSDDLPSHEELQLWLRVALELGVRVELLLVNDCVLRGLVERYDPTFDVVSVKPHGRDVVEVPLDWVRGARVAPRT